MATGGGKIDTLQLNRSTTAEMIYSDFEAMLAGDKNALQSLVDLNLTLMHKIESLEIEARNSFRATDPIMDRLNTLEIELTHLQNENSALKLKIAQTEDATKQMYLRIEGLAEGSNESLITQVVNAFSKTGVVCDQQDIDFARRVGKYQEGSCRPILVRLMKEAKRNEILYARNNVNKNLPRGATLLWINDDVSEETRRMRKTIRDIATLAKLNGDEGIRVHSDGLIYGDDKYRMSDLDLLPSNISVEKAKSRTSEADIYFQGEHSPFSNFFPATFTDDEGFIYHSAEQAFQHKKAKAHAKHKIANKILKTRNPYEVKRLSKKVPTSQEWKNGEDTLMEQIVTNKFEQNDALAAQLILTDKRQLHEASSDPKWGTGAELSSKALLQGDWTGQDKLGMILESVRGKLANKYPPPILNAHGTDISDQNLNVDTAMPLPDDDIEPINEPIVDQPVQKHISPRARPQVAPPPPPTNQTTQSTSNQSADRNRGKAQAKSPQQQLTQQAAQSTQKPADKTHKTPQPSKSNPRAQAQADIPKQQGKAQSPVPRGNRQTRTSAKASSSVEPKGK